MHVEEAEIAGKRFKLESGAVARQADGAVLVTWGDTKVLATVVTSPLEQDIGYFPLRVDFEEKFYAGGKIPGGFFKREGKPSDAAILSARLIDRPIRPLFPKGYREEVHIVTTVLSAEKDCPPEIAAMVGASAALMISPAPFQGPIAGVKVGLQDGEVVVNPPDQVLDEGDMDITVAGTKSTVTMVEGHMREVPEEKVIEAIVAAHEVIRELIELEERFAAQHQVEKRVPEPPAEEEREVYEQVKELVWERLPELKAAPNKKARERLAEAMAAEAAQQVADRYPEGERERILALAKATFDDVYREFARWSILELGERMDGRRPDELRPITIQVGILPRVHGSALFTRGETQSLGTCTLGATRRDAQIVDLMMEEGLKRFMLHYNFPPFSVGEAGRMGPPSRREIGHGHLAEGALQAVVPPEEEFPYIIRVVSEILESNGSSSMASVCSGCLAMMDAGVPIKRPVAGVAMGLVTDEATGKYVILTDILGLEDHFGDMDFKVAGTREGVTAFQLDVHGLQGGRNPGRGHGFSARRQDRGYLPAAYARGDGPSPGGPHADPGPDGGGPARPQAAPFPLCPCPGRHPHKPRKDRPGHRSWRPHHPQDPGGYRDPDRHPGRRGGQDRRGLRRVGGPGPEDGGGTHRRDRSGSGPALQSGEDRPLRRLRGAQTRR